MTVGDRRETATVLGGMRHERRRVGAVGKDQETRIERITGPRYLCEALMYWRNSADGKARAWPPRCCRRSLPARSSAIPISASPTSTTKRQWYAVKVSLCQRGSALTIWRASTAPAVKVPTLRRLGRPAQLTRISATKE